MKTRVPLTAIVCVLVLSAPCFAAKKKSKTRLYRNERSGFCAQVPANWKGPAEIASRAGARFDAPDGGGSSITFALAPNEPRSIVLQQKDAGAQMATLDDYRDAIPNTWRNDHSVSDVKVTQEEPVTLSGVPAIRIELAYKRSREAWRYEIVFALSNNEQFAAEYDATKRSAKHYEDAFREAVSSFEFHCSADEQQSK